MRNLSFTGAKLGAALSILLFAPLSTLQAQQGSRQGIGKKPASNTSAPSVAGDLIDFENVPEGRVLTSVFSRNGLGPVLIRGLNPDLGNVDAAVIFNSAAPTGADFDLGTPHISFGGPGRGAAGRMGMPYENAVAQGHLLIVAENLVDANADGLIDEPDDADVTGESIAFDFSALGTVTLHSLRVIDIESDEPSGQIILMAPDGSILASLQMPIIGNNGSATMQLGSLTGIGSMLVLLNGSGAIDDLDLSQDVVAPGQIGDTVYCDLNNNGIQNPGEAGIAGLTVLLRCAGADGLLNTADDFQTSQLSDASGGYLFTGLTPDICEVTVDPASVPPGKLAGACLDTFTVNLAAGQSYLDADFCFITPAEIGDTVFCDLDLDGVQSPGEPGIQGVSVTLRCAGADGSLGTADDSIETQVTDSSGNFLFTGVLPGDCRVSVQAGASTAGKIPGSCPGSYDLTLFTSDSILTADFCFITPPGRVGDTVFCDTNRDGIQDAGEPGIQGAVVQLTCVGIDGMFGTQDDLTQKATTDANGHYLFSNIPAGMCRADVDVNTGGIDKLLGDCPSSVSFLLAAGSDYLDADYCFVLPQPGMIGDLVWCDSDDDGLFDMGEYGIAGVRVNLTCAGPDGILDTSDDLRDSRLTDASGNYLFASVAPDLCRVDVDPSTAPIEKQAGLCPLSVTMDLQAGQSFLDADFCFANRPGEIGDLVFCDLNDDGLFDMGEPGIQGVVVNLRCAGSDGILNTADDVLESTLTDGMGRYLFSDVAAPSTCEVSVDVTSAPADKVLGRCPTQVSVMLLPAGSFLVADFCFVTPASLGDFVFCDINDDGIQDVGDPGVAGVRVDLTCAGPDGLLGTSDDTFDSQVTDANGHYLFDGITPGLCQVDLGQSSIPSDKELGQCPTTLTMNLTPGQEYLEADYCVVTSIIVASCCDDGKPAGLTMIYTGAGCSASSNSQDASKLVCSGDPMFAPRVYIIADNGKDPASKRYRLWFAGEVDLDAKFVIDSGFAGEDKLNPVTRIIIEDLAGNLLQTTEFHTSCSQPLNSGDQFGANLLYLCTGTDPGVPGGSDQCDSGKPQVLSMRYTGENCSASSTTQDPKKTFCAGDPAFAARVHILVTDKQKPDDKKAKITFQGDVDLNTSFNIDAKNAGLTRLKANTWVHIFDVNGGMILQTLNFHTSCSQPLFLGDQFGSLILEGFIVE